MKNVDAPAEEVNYPEPRMAIRPEADSGDEDRTAARRADIHQLFFVVFHPLAPLLTAAERRFWVNP